MHRAAPGCITPASPHAASRHGGIPGDETQANRPPHPFGCPSIRRQSFGAWYSWLQGSTAPRPSDDPPWETRRSGPLHPGRISRLSRWLPRGPMVSLRTLCNGAVWWLVVWHVCFASGAWLRHALASRLAWARRGSRGATRTWKCFRATGRARGSSVMQLRVCGGSSLAAWGVARQ